MYSVSYRYNPNTSNPYSVYKQPNPNSHICYSVYEKRNYSFPYEFGFDQIIWIRYTPTSCNYMVHSVMLKVKGCIVSSAYCNVQCIAYCNVHGVISKMP